ncbi:Protein N-lysine methyltransferase METTL21A [Hondaea fermentalgiana]|uniref:Protein N-lysine methyltransferase METTL21A n=1 Tax=Hondaea fermentalgiana TaxID=2315210 RepID=A0A2R5G208_9STRA|nr:Protein N-lysine methyltransferase METTL21A [Hondaea fermentalgiana]|eukprot:GBG24575.1 Protein N-lysine methyltransferase METTL21A [Hondaea fermentalgiana]
MAEETGPFAGTETSSATPVKRNEKEGGGKKELDEDEEEEEEEGEDEGGFGLDFVFQDWLDPQTFTNHRANNFDLLGVQVQQGAFCHTKDNDQTGAVVWDDAVMLARHLVARFPASLRGKTVIDLGAGTGFLGLAVAHGCSADVIITDREVMRALIEQNVEVNKACIAAQGGSACFVPHSWGDPLKAGIAEHAPFDIVLASGCIYHEEANPALLKSLRALAGATGDIYVAIDFRFDVTKQDKDDPYAAPVVASFLSQAKSAGLELRELPADESDQGLALAREHVKKSVRIFRGCFL